MIPYDDDPRDRERDRRLDQHHEPPNYWDKHYKGEENE